MHVGSGFRSKWILTLLAIGTRTQGKAFSSVKWAQKAGVTRHERGKVTSTHRMTQIPELPSLKAFHFTITRGGREHRSTLASCKHLGPHSQALRRPKQVPEEARMNGGYREGEETGSLG